ncbi:TetR/AcrR family transcriptional regulator [Flavobacterium sp. CYK-4]|uniref:TetR/AcrR family transcriptional regulator n=1 Tax=Flavobacterium lotistagni TaxID=2709660 RepID=UPI0014087AF0|nr:TetR/AcrR family transcriptional regulator [Flavobacterium lotistagni]NHM06857.1 TetR/AcrR family transcriptional regulator [Flavobacterium lotistagni]
MIQQTSTRQIEIIEAAGRLLMKSGIKGLTTKNLAQEMGFSESALYRHFKNKEDIIVLLIGHLESNIKDRLGEVSQSKLSGTEKLQAIFKSQFAYFSQNPHFIIAILSEGLFDETEKIHSAVMKIISFKLQLLAGIIEQAKEENQITDEVPTLDLVHILIGSFRLMMLRWKLSQFQIDLNLEGNRIIQTNLKLFKK